MFASKNMPIPKETHPVEDNDCRVEPYNYDNMNDSQYCPNVEVLFNKIRKMN